ncbi:hypothetical protein [Flavobacterium olei]|uniref:hypothetical protein n=1 Tax=Flavobacterium olei TaxID=1886782 RepID=UPI00321A771B
MALSTNGSISMGDINQEIGRARTASISLDAAENGSYATINQSSPNKPSSTNPATISEWRGYNHTATAPSIVLNSYSNGYLYFTVSGTGYSPSALTVKKSITSATGPWTNETAGPNSPRTVAVPTVTTWYMIEDASNPSIYSNVYQHISALDTTPPSIPDSLACDQGSGVRSMYVSWNPSTDNKGVTGYELQRRTGAGVWSTKYVGPNIFYQDEGSYSTTYSFQVRAFDAAGNYSAYSAIATWKTGATSCFVEGTLISLPDGTQRAIETLQVDNLVLSAEIRTLTDTNNVKELYKWYSSHLSENRVTAPITYIEQKIAYETIIINNGLLEATPLHSQLIQRDEVWKFIPIGEVIVGDNLYGIDKKIIPVTSIAINREKRSIYPMSLSPSHIYFANGILTHNIKPKDPV